MQESLCSYVFSTGKLPQCQQPGHILPYRPRSAISYKTYILKPTRNATQRAIWNKESNEIHHYAERTVTVNSVFFPLLLLLILSLVLKTSCFPQRMYKFAAFNMNTFPRFASFALNRRLVTTLELFWNPAHLDNRKWNLKGLFSDLNLEK